MTELDPAWQEVLRDYIAERSAIAHLLDPNPDDLVKSICNAIRFAYDMTRRNVDHDIPWSGPGKAQLRAARLYDRDALEEIIKLALQERRDA